MNTPRVNVIAEGMPDFEKAGLLLGVNSYKELGCRLGTGREFTMNGIGWRVERIEAVDGLQTGTDITIYLHRITDFHEPYPEVAA